MKKVLTILVVLTLIAGFAFADKTSETHTLTITASVDAAIPQFQLFRGTVKTNDSAAGFDAAALSYTDNDEAGFNLDEGGSVEVKARVVNLAKQKQNYNLTFSNGTFGVKRDGEDQSFDPTSITVSKNNETTDGVTLSQENGSTTVTAAFNGTKMTEGNYLIATATYAYTGDSTIDPGEYTANIVLTVAAV